MPTILSFMPCKQVIISQGDDHASIISIIDRVNLDLPTAVELPKNIPGPLEWAIHILLRRDPEDIGRRYEHRTEIIWPDGEIWQTVEDTIELETKMQRVVYRLSTFPIAQAGDVRLAFKLRQEGSGDAWDEPVIFYAVEVRHNRVELPQEDIPSTE